jgi:hypothetical protein
VSANGSFDKLMQTLAFAVEKFCAQFDQTFSIPHRIDSTAKPASSLQQSNQVTVTEQRAGRA